MKRLLYVFAAVLLTAVFAGAQSQSQSQASPDQGVSLGDAARAARAQKTPPSPNAQVFTNDNLPTSGGISTTSGSYAGVTPPAPPKAGAKPDAEKGKSEEEAKAKQADEYKQKAGDLKKQIDSLKHDIDIMQREDKLRQQMNYYDVGGQVRPENQQKYIQGNKKYQEDLQAKQDQLNQAQQQLDQLREEIRKAGLPSSIAE